MDKRKPTQIADVGEQDDREHNDPEYTYTCLTHRYIDESKQGPRDYVWAGNCDFAWNTRTRRSTIDSTPTIHFSRWSFVRINSPKDHIITHTHPPLPLHPWNSIDSFPLAYVRFRIFLSFFFFVLFISFYFVSVRVYRTFLIRRCFNYISIRMLAIILTRIHHRDACMRRMIRRRKVSLVFCDVQFFKNTRRWDERFFLSACCGKKERFFFFIIWIRSLHLPVFYRVI